MTLLRRIPVKTINSKISSSLICLAIVLLMFILFGSVEAFAAEKPCTLTVNIISSDSSAEVSGLKIGLCRIAYLNNGEYTLTDDFADSGISLDNISDKTNHNHYSEIYRYITSNDIEYLTAVTNSEGSALFSDLDEGMYLIFCEESQNLTFSPYMVFLPSVVNGEYVYDVVSEPKTIFSEDNVKNITVTKLWNDNDDYAGKRPESVVVTLKKDGKAYKTAELNDECNWKYVFENLPADSLYAVEEEQVDSYEPSYEGRADSGFIITNTLTAESPIMGFVKTGIGSGVIAIAFLSLIFAFILILLFRKQKNK